MFIIHFVKLFSRNFESKTGHFDYRCCWEYQWSSWNLILIAEAIILPAKKVCYCWVANLNSYFMLINHVKILENLWSDNDKNILNYYIFSLCIQSRMILYFKIHNWIELLTCNIYYVFRPQLRNFSHPWAKITHQLLVYKQCYVMLYLIISGHGWNFS